MNPPKQISDSLSISDSAGAGVQTAEPSQLDVSNLYILFYIERPPHVYQKFFRLDGTFRQVIEKARVYCDTMRYRFIIVRPFISNFDEEMHKQQSESNV